MQTIHWGFYARVAQYEQARTWIELLAKLQKAPKTIDAYARCLDDLIAFFEQTRLPLIEASRGDVATYLNHLCERMRPSSSSTNTTPTRRGLANATIQQRLTVARLWYDHLIACKIRTDVTNPVGRGTYRRGIAIQGADQRGLLPRQTKQPWIPGDDEWDTFLDRVLCEEPLRNQVMVLLAYEGALRRSELVALRVSDIDWPHQTITIRPEVTKNQRGRLIFYSEATQGLLAAYIRQRQQLIIRYRGVAAGPVFLSESKRNPGQPLSSEMWNKIVQHIAQRVGLPQFTTHTFRHLRLTDLARCKLELYEIALLAGHKSLESTQLYIQLSGRELGERVRTATQHINAALKRKIQQQRGA